MRNLKKYILFIFVGCALSLNSAESSTPELDGLERLSAASQKTVRVCQSLKQKIVHYLATQEEFSKNMDDKELCYKMIKEARVVLNEIEENHLQYAFDTNFLNELTLFSKMAKTPSIPPPR